MSIRTGVSGSGYLTVRDAESGDWVYVHRLAACADHDPAVVAASDVHHVDGLPENNGRDNLQPLPAALHRAETLNGDL